jgi:superfamily II DNA or RNA helicase
MPFRLPAALRSVLWTPQRDAIDAMSMYVRKFDASSPRAGLVQMPTGSGKTGIIAILARCLREVGTVIVLAPRVGLREQLARDIETQFFRNISVEPASLPRRVVELKKGNVDPGALDDLVLVTTVQMLLSLKAGQTGLYERLARNVRLVLFDEGHYEPATVWSDVVRSFACPRIVFSATPFRDDFKLFDVDDRYSYRLSFKSAVQARYIRDVRLHQCARVTSPGDFAEEVVKKYDELFESMDHDDPKKPRVIIRCDRPEHIRQLAHAFKGHGRTVVGIHEQFDERPEAGERRRVPNPKLEHAAFWIHQFKLLEGIDDPRFQLLACYSELRSVRAFVQQVGRVVRNPSRQASAVAHVMDYSVRHRQSELWKSFLAYDSALDGGKVVAASLNPDVLLDALRGALPGILYVDGRFRAPKALASLEMGEVQLPLSANVFKRPKNFSLAQVREKITRQCLEEDLLFHAPVPSSDTATVFYVGVRPSPFLETGFFPEPKLGITLVHQRGKYVFVYDSGRGLGATAVDASPVGLAVLKKAFVRNPTSRLTHASIVNANVGADQVRSRSTAAVQIDALVPTFDEHSYVLSTATGYSVGRHGDSDSDERIVRRYIGVGNGRVSDLGSKFGPVEVWRTWCGEIETLLDGTRPALSIFGRWASPARVPNDPAPRNVLLDLRDVMHLYAAVGDDELEEGEAIEPGELCADVNRGRFSVLVNGQEFELQIVFDRERERYVLKSHELDARFHASRDDGNAGESLTQYLNRTQSFRVLPATPRYFYTLGQFCQPRIAFGPEYDDAKMGVLASIQSIAALANIHTEKGRRTRGTSGWEAGSLFDLIDHLGQGTELGQHFEGTRILVCDDMGTESADFIVAQDATKSHRRRVIFIHAKADAKGSTCSASALQDVCGQAQKNLREVSLFADVAQSKTHKWSGPWTCGHTTGTVAKRVRRHPSGTDPEDAIRKLVKDPTADREVWIVLGNILSKTALERDLLKDSPKGHSVQAAYLLFSTVTSVAAAGARLTVFCG